MNFRRALGASLVLALSTIWGGCTQDRAPTSPLDTELGDELVAPDGAPLLLDEMDLARTDPTLGSLEPSAPGISVPWRRHRRHLRRFLQPLGLGSRWEYRRRVAVRILLEGQAPMTEVVRSSVEREIIGTEERFGREYTVEATHHVQEGRPPGTLWARLRQDRSGLYQADIASSIPPDQAGQHAFGTDPWTSEPLPRPDRLESHPHREALLVAWNRLNEKRELVQGVIRQAAKAGNPPDNEITRLAYPMRRGAEWVIRDDPLFTSVVQGLQLVRTPAGWFLAWRVRIQSDLFDPNDRVFTWWGRVGLIAFWARVQSNAVDEQGNVVGVVRSRELEILRDFELHGRSPRDAADWR